MAFRVSLKLDVEFTRPERPKKFGGRSRNKSSDNAEFLALARKSFAEECGRRSVDILVLAAWVTWTLTH